MLLPKETLEKVSYYEYTTHTVSSASHWVDDVVTLHFNPFWMKSKKIRSRRVVTNIDSETGTYQHHPSEEMSILLTQLQNYMATTFEQDELDELFPDMIEETEEKEK